MSVLTEQWVHEMIYCPNCGSNSLNKYPNNKKVADFFCLSCHEDYELKSKNGAFGSKITAGDHNTMINRLKSSRNPNLFLLNYDKDSNAVLNFIVIPKQFLIPEIIEKRKPLSQEAKRAGWVGCMILLKSIPESGRIFYIKDKKVQTKDKILAEWQKTLFLRSEKNVPTKGWLLDIMRCIEKTNKLEFTNQDIYAFENELSILHPNNKHIRDKIRQQLQVLCKNGYIDSVVSGNYSICNK